ncbi:MAG: Na+/H+ antiporter subunit E [Rhodospirillales bacterium]
MRRLMPHPWLTVLITVVWMLLNNSLSAGHLVLGLICGVAIPKITSVYWPGSPRIRNPVAIAEYTMVVLWDIVVSNVQVARLILFRSGDTLRSRYVTVPLALKSPEAITVLAGTITMTPGTVTADVSADGRALLVHCIEADDPAGVVAQIKSRYERRLMRIFE